MRKTIGEKNTMNLYEHNDTMKILGKQFYTAAADENINEVLGAYKAWHCLDDFKSLCFDIYNLGFINGIRDERERRKAKNGQ